jgi:hypothetical protein
MTALLDELVLGSKLGVTVRITLEKNRKTWKEGHFVVAEHR